MVGKITVTKAQALAGLGEFMAATQGSHPELAMTIIGTQLDHKQLLAVMAIGQLMYSPVGYSRACIQSVIREACLELGWPAVYVEKEILRYHARINRRDGFLDIPPSHAGATLPNQP